MTQTKALEESVSKSRKRILEAAHDEVVNRGILGMRVASVASRAGCSITSMYRYFGSRDGLLAEVLIGLYEESFDQQYDVIRKHLVGTGPLTIDDVLASIPLPRHEFATKEHALRSQVLAVAGTNAILRERLAESLKARRTMLERLIDDVAQRLPEGTTFNRDVITVLVFNINWQYNDLMGESAVTNDQYLALLRRLIVGERPDSAQSSR